MIPERNPADQRKPAYLGRASTKPSAPRPASSSRYRPSITARTDADRERHEAWVEETRRYQTWLAHCRSVLRARRRCWAGALEEVLPCSAYTNLTDGRAELRRRRRRSLLPRVRDGAYVVADCAVRGLDMVGGRVAGVITEKGRIKCDGVVLAAAVPGCGCSGWRLRRDAAAIEGASHRPAATAPIEGLPEASGNTGEFGSPLAVTGGYTIASGGGSHVVPLVPDTFRLFAKFLPALIAEWGALRLRFDDRFMTEARMPRRWDRWIKPSPFEATRVLDPTPDTQRTEYAVNSMKAVFPAAAKEWRSCSNGPV